MSLENKVLARYKLVNFKQAKSASCVPYLVILETFSLYLKALMISYDMTCLGNVLICCVWHVRCCASWKDERELAASLFG